MVQKWMDLRKTSLYEFIKSDARGTFDAAVEVLSDTQKGLLRPETFAAASGPLSQQCSFSMSGLEPS